MDIVTFEEERHPTPRDADAAVARPHAELVEENAQMPPELLRVRAAAEQRRRFVEGLRRLGGVRAVGAS